MNKLLSFFDYIFFRAYVHFRSEAPIALFKAVNWTTIVEFALLFAIAVTTEALRILPRVAVLLPWLMATISLAIWNHYRYRKLWERDRLAGFYQRWANEEVFKRRIKGWLIAFLPLLFFLGGPFAAHICSKHILK